jgi:DNA-binding transcriptional LysR family regulator
MEWLNFHHLRYFWTVAKTESVRKAAEQLHVSQPSISAQLKLLEETLGQKLFQRSGRNLVLTEVGQLVLSYADEIFSIGRELMSAVRQRPGNRALRFNVGMTDALSKLIAFEILKSAFRFADPVHIVCRQAEIGPLVHQLQAHRLDIAISIFRREDCTALPVTDSLGVLIGIVTVDDVLDVAEPEATEDIQKIGGVEALEEPFLQIPLARLIRKRANWLVILFFGELLTATAMGFFEKGD